MKTILYLCILIGDGRSQAQDLQAVDAGTRADDCILNIEDEDTDEKSTYQIVGSHEADVDSGKLSVTSTLSRALIGKPVGATVEVTTPNGSKIYEVIKVQFK